MERSCARDSRWPATLLAMLEEATLWVAAGGGLWTGETMGRGMINPEAWLHVLATNERVLLSPSQDEHTHTLPCQAITLTLPLQAITLPLCHV